MSMMQVQPPAAAAFVAVAKPSQCARPGSFTCTCVSTTPGRMHNPSSAHSFSQVSIDKMRPFSNAIDAGLSPSAVSTCRDFRKWVTRSCCYTALVLQTPESWMEHAIQLAIDNVARGQGGPFGALVVRNNELIATGVNRVTG